MRRPTRLTIAFLLAAGALSPAVASTAGSPSFAGSVVGQSNSSIELTVFEDRRGVVRGKFSGTLPLQCEASVEGGYAPLTTTVSIKLPPFDGRRFSARRIVHSPAGNLVSVLFVRGEVGRSRAAGRILVATNSPESTNRGADCMTYQDLRWRAESATDERPRSSLAAR